MGGREPSATQRAVGYPARSPGTEALGVTLTRGAPRQGRAVRYPSAGPHRRVSSPRANPTLELHCRDKGVASLPPTRMRMFLP